MADVQAVSPVGQLPSSGSMGHRSPGPRSTYDPRSPTHYGSRPNSRVSFSDGGRPHSRQHSGGRIPRPPSQPRGSPDGSSGRERPPSVRSLHEKVDMSEFLSPAVKSAVRRWKRFHEEKVRERFKERRESKKQYIQAVKMEKKKLSRKIPIDVLALEWMTDNQVTVDARAYLLDKLLPTLILGIEKLLMEVDKRHLAEETEVNPNFNPINYLAQYLMRNNPRYSNFPEASPYIRGLQEVTIELKNHVFSFEDNRLAKVKAEARKKREQQVKAENMRTKERLARSGRIREHYNDWMLEENGQVLTQVIHSALKNFSEVLDGLSDEMKKGVDFSVFLKPLEKDTIEAEEFVEYVRKLVTRMSPDLFNELMVHMDRCSTAYRKAAILEARKDILIELFKNCDHASIGIIDRHRVLGLFKAFYDKQPWVTKRYIRNPRRWPVVELDEVGDDESSASEDSRVSSRMSASTLGSRPGSQAGAIERPSSVPAGVKDHTGEEAADKDIPAEEKASPEAPAESSEVLPAEAEGKAEEAVTTAADGEKQEEGEEKAAEEEKEDGEVAAVADKEEEAVTESETKETDVKDENKPTEPAPTGDTPDKGEGDGGESKDEIKTSEDNSQKSDEKESNEAPAVTSDEVPDVKTEQESKPDQPAEATAGDVTSAEAVPEAKKDEEKTEKVAEDGKDSEAAADAATTESKEESKSQEAETKEGDESKEAGKGSEAAVIAAPTEPKEESESKEAETKEESESKEAETKEESKSRKESEEKVEEDKAQVEETGDETKKEAEKSEKEEGKENVAVEGGADAKQEDGETPKEEDSKVEVTSENKETVEGVETKDVAPEKKEEEAQGEEETGDSTESLPKTAATGRGTAVSFSEDALAVKERKQGMKSPVKTPTTRSGSVVASAFDQNTLNTSQFVQLTEVFLGEDPPEEVVLAVIKFIQNGYVETEEEKFKRLQKARREEQLAKRKLMMDQLFDKWDNDGSGFLDLDELHSVMSKFKENMEKKIVGKAKQMLEKEDNDHKLSKTEFKKYLEVVCSLLPGGEDNFDPLVEFLMTSVERSYEERIRGQARKKWLAQIKQTAETSGASMDPVYKSVFNILYKDSEQHGRGKRISGNIAMLERNDNSPARGPTCLRYVASTPDDAHFMVNKIMYRDMKGISFTSVDSGKPIHVPRVQNHGNIMFWNPERSEEDRQGSFIVIPLKDHRKRVFGTMGIDTLNDPQEKSIFITHEISFFQGVAKAFSHAFQYVDIRRKTLRIAESALAWIHRRSPHVQEISVYIVEPDDKDVSATRSRQTSTRNRKMAKYIADDTESIKLEDFILRRMLSTDKSGNIISHDHPTKLERKENLFRDYLFKCVDNSETVTADAYGHRHIAFPLRDVEGHCVALVDISIGELKQLPSHENKEVQRMLKLLQFAHKEVSSESEGRDQKVVLEAEKNSEESRIDIMFDRIMLTDLRETVGKLNLRAFAELKSYKDPPKVIHDILVSVLSLFYQEKAELGELEEYHNCKQFVNPELIKKIEEFDPTALEAVGAVNRIAARLKEVPHGAVAKHGSLPAQHLYNWAFVCLSLLEHTSKMKQNQKLPPTRDTPPGSAMSGGVTEQ